MKTLLVLNAGIEAVPGIIKAKSMGLKIVVCDKNKLAPGFKYADYKVFTSIYDHKKIIESLDKVFKKIKIDGVITFSSDASLSTSKIAKKLNLPGNSIQSSVLSTDKLKMKKKFKIDKIPIPWFKEIKNLKDLKSVLKKKKSKYVLKPIDSRGARGVLQIDTKTDLKWAYNHSISKSNKKKLIIEKFLSGKQISTESILYEKDAITPGMIERNYEYLKKFSPFIIENGGQQPINLSKKKLKNISDLVIRAGRSLGIKKGIVKGDVVFHKNKPYVIEIATRLSGGWMSSHQIPYATGVDILKLAIQLSLGKKINLNLIKIQKKKSVAIRYLFPKENSNFKIKKKIKPNKYIKKFMIYLKKNEIVQKFSDHTKRAGFVIASAHSKKKAVIEATKFIKIIQQSNI
jgi:biotin carboxylase